MAIGYLGEPVQVKIGVSGFRYTIYNDPADAYATFEALEDGRLSPHWELEGTMQPQAEQVFAYLMGRAPGQQMEVDLELCAPSLCWPLLEPLMKQLQAPNTAVTVVHWDEMEEAAEALADEIGPNAGTYSMGSLEN